MSNYEKPPNKDRSSVDISDTLENSTSGDDKEEAPLLDEPLDSDERYGRRDVVETKEKSPARIAFFASLGILLCSVIFYAYKYTIAPSDAACERKMWAYSPMQEVMEFEWRQYDSDIIPPKYFGEPTDERRALWELIYDEGDIGFPYDKLAMINKSAEAFDWWRLPAPNDDQVIAFPEMTHQFHCVALLWLFEYREHWDYQTFMNSTLLIFELHANHCYLSLLTMIKCQADVTPVLFQKDHSEMGTWKTRDAPHRCKKFDQLAEWEGKHKVCRMNCVQGDFASEMTSQVHAKAGENGPG